MKIIHSLYKYFYNVCHRKFIKFRKIKDRNSTHNPTLYRSRLSTFWDFSFQTFLCINSDFWTREIQRKSPQPPSHMFLTLLYWVVSSLELRQCWRLGAWVQRLLGYLGMTNDDHCDMSPSPLPFHLKVWISCSTSQAGISLFLASSGCWR